MNQLARRLRRKFTVVVSPLLVAGAAAAPAYAAAPANDSITTPTRVRTVPQRFDQDNSDATAERSDGGCVRGASVWYRYEPTTTARVRVVTFGSDYDTVLAVYQGRRSNRTLVSCSDDLENVLFSVASAARVRFVAGETYLVAVSACCNRRAPGGHGALTLYRGGQPGVHTTFGSVKTGEVSGRLFIDGTTTCDTPSASAVEVRASQRVGDHVARGDGLVEMDGCGAEATAWRLTIDTETGWAFQEGKASLHAASFTDDGFEFASDQQTLTADVGSDPDARSGRTGVSGR
jgi:hypothetical protein